MPDTDRRSFRFSLLDLVIILLILGVLAGIVLRFRLVEKLIGKTRLQEASVTFLAEGLTGAECALLTDGTVLSAGGELAGVLSGTETAPAVLSCENSDGRLVSYESDSLFDLTGKLTVDLLVTENGCFWRGETFIAAGSRFTLRTAGVDIAVVITEVTVPTA